VNTRTKYRGMSGWLLLGIVLCGIPVTAQDIELSTAGAGPRKLEATLQQSIPRDYAKAWETLEAALENGDSSRLDRYWVGVAHDKFQRLVNDQAATGVQVRYKDTAHQLQAMFYPTDGAALVLYDTVTLQVQVVRSGKTIHTENATEKYFVLMTPAQDRWLVRVFQALPLS
jgi:hypothetical protein